MSTHKTCRQCRQLIQILTDQIKQLQHRQQSLKNLNTALLQNLGTPTDNNQSLTDWKQKYEREVERSCRLERQLMEIQIESEIERKSAEKKRQSVAKLNNMIMSAKLNGMEMENVYYKDYNGRSGRKSIISSGENCFGRNQLVLRIVR